MSEKPDLKEEREVDMDDLIEAEAIAAQHPVTDTVAKRARRKMGRKRGRPRGSKNKAVVKSTDDLEKTIVPPKAGKRHLWDRRADALKRKGTTPRDMFWHDAFAVKMPKHVDEKIKIYWMSDIMWERRPPCEGFMYDIWEPVTKEVMDELGIKVVTKNFGQDGVPRVGDAFLMWAPKEITLQMRAYWKEKSLAARKSTDSELKRAIRETLAEEGLKDGTGVIGKGIRTTGDPGDFAGMKDEELGEMGRRWQQTTDEEDDAS
jgi:hypothetical protein